MLAKVTGEKRETLRKNYVAVIRDVTWKKMAQGGGARGEELTQITFLFARFFQQYPLSSKQKIKPSPPSRERERERERVHKGKHIIYSQYIGWNRIDEVALVNTVRNVDLPRNLVSNSGREVDLPVLKCRHPVRSLIFSSSPLLSSP